LGRKRRNGALFTTLTGDLGLTATAAKQVHWTNH